MYLPVSYSISCVCTLYFTSSSNIALKLAMETKYKYHQPAITLNDFAHSEFTFKVPTGVNEFSSLYKYRFPQLMMTI